MINKIDFNRLYFTKTLTGRFQDKYNIKGQSIIFFDQDKFTSFQIDLTSLNEVDIANVNITLVDSANMSNEINFKTIIESGELVYENNILYYKSSKNLTENILGCYYLKIDNGTNYIYSNDFSFFNLGYATASGEGFVLFSKTDDSTGLDIVLTSTENASITVEWGDSGSTTQTVTSSGTTFSKTYTSNADYQIKISGELTKIIEIEINNDSITAIDDLRQFNNLDVLDLENCKYTYLSFSGISNMREYIANNTLIRTIDGFSSTKGEVLSISECTNITLNSRSFANLNTKLVELKADGCLLNLVAEAYTSDGWTKISNIDLSNNRLTSIPNFINNTTVFPEDHDIRSFNVSSNNINGNPAISAYLNNYGLAFLSRCEVFDFSYNSISQEYVDTILELIAFSSITAIRTSLSIDISGFNKYIIGNAANASPSNRITALEPILIAGEDYLVDDILPVNGDNGTGATIIVTSVDSLGGVTGYDVETYGSGYTTPGIVAIGGTGNGVSILVKSAKVRMVDDGATVITN